MLVLTLSSGDVVTFDDEDAGEVAAFEWKLLKVTTKNRVYKYAQAPSAGKTVLLHRWICKAPLGKVVDHIDGNGLNNVRSNLRLCSHAENLCNTRRQFGKDLPKGVLKRKGRYGAQIRFGNIRRQRSGFDTVEEALKVYTEWAEELHGVFARLD